MKNKFSNQKIFSKKSNIALQYYSSNVGLSRNPDSIPISAFSLLPSVVQVDVGEENQASHRRGVEKKVPSGNVPRSSEQTLRRAGLALVIFHFCGVSWGSVNSYYHLRLKC